MRNYIENLKERPDHHKRRFALLVSGTFTLAIFAIWTLTTFSPNESVVATENKVKVEERGPLSSLTSSFATVFQAVKGDINTLKSLLPQDDQ